MVGPSRPIYTLLVQCYQVVPGQIYQIYTICSRVQIKREDNSRVVAACSVATWAEKHEPKWPKPSQMQPMS